MWYVHTRSLTRAFAIRLNIRVFSKLLTENHLGFLSFIGGCTGSSESTRVKVAHCRKSHVTARFNFTEERGRGDPGASRVFR